jgi:hypothetical protein
MHKAPEGLHHCMENKFSCQQTYTREFSITVVLKYKEFSFMITCVYGPTENSDKLRFLNEIRVLRTITYHPWMILRDFNINSNFQETT